MRSVLAAAVSLLVALLASSIEAKPHIILMVLDDVGYTDTGIYGESNIPMPHLKDIAKEGVVFDNFYVQPVCSPTRTSVLTGLFPFRFGLQQHMPTGPAQSAAVPLDTPMLPALLKSQGYERHAIGKWHAGYATWDHFPTNRGFQSYTGYLQGQGDYYTHEFSVFDDMDGGPQKILKGFDFWQNTRPFFEARGNYSLDIYQDTLTRVFRNYALRQDTLVKQRENPLFVYLAHQTVHIPIQYRKEEDRCAQIKVDLRRKYCNMLVELDDAVGDMVDQLKSIGLWDNTLILTMTDNGGMVHFASHEDGSLASYASQGSNYPLRGAKTTLFEGGVRGLGFAGGGYIPKEGRGRRVKELAHAVDFSATVLSLGGVLPAKKELYGIDGKCLFGLISNQAGPHAFRDHVPINIVDGGLKYTAIRFGNYKLIIDEFLNPPAQGWFDKNGNLIEAAPSAAGKTLLFDLENDPEERKDISKENPQLVSYAKELIRMYVQGGNYMDPQEGDRLYARGLPVLNGGVWKPGFMGRREWEDKYKRTKAKSQKRYANSEVVDSNDAKADGLDNNVLKIIPSDITLA